MIFLIVSKIFEGEREKKLKRQQIKQKKSDEQDSTEDFEFNEEKHPDLHNFQDSLNITHKTQGLTIGEGISISKVDPIMPLFNKKTKSSIPSKLRNF